MGTGRSCLPNQAQYGNIFVDDAMREGWDALTHDPSASYAFALFIKGGSWVGKFGEYGNKEGLRSKATHGERLAKELNCPLCAYEVPTELLPSMQNPSSYSESRRAACTWQSIEDAEPAPPRQETTRYVADRAASEATDSTFFTPGNLQLILAASAYRCYRSSHEYREWVWISEGVAENEDLDRENTELTANDDSVGDLQQVRNSRERPAGIQRVEDLFIRAAYAPTVAELVQKFHSDDWVNTMLRSIDTLPYGLTVCSAEESNFPILFTNHTFRNMTGYSDEAALCGEDVRKLLRGADTEPNKAAFWDEALTNGTAAKLCITHYDHHQAPYLSLAALQPVYDQAEAYKYVIILHMNPARSPISHHMLKVVDSFLHLLPRLLIRPRP